MVVVKIEIWPHGDESKAYPFGRINIINDGSGDNGTGNYKVEALHSGKFVDKPGIFKTGVVKGFQRTLSVYRLLFRALASIRET
jgi:hypothetical protein